MIRIDLRRRVCQLAGLATVKGEYSDGVSVRSKDITKLFLDDTSQGFLLVHCNRGRRGFSAKRLWTREDGTSKRFCYPLSAQGCERLKIPASILCRNVGSSIQTCVMA